MGTLRNALGGICVAVVLLAVVDVAVRIGLPRSDRLNENFSATYLRREIHALRGTSPIVVLGDSALWGYGLPAQRAALTLLRRQGIPNENLSYEGGSPPNTYAMLQVLFGDGVRPRLVVFNVNQKEFNPLDSAYRQLHPSVERLAWSALTPSERALLKPTQPGGADQTLQRVIESTWQLYGMRNDLREWLFGDVDAIHVAQGAIERLSGTATRRRAAHRPTAEAFEGTYDLTPLSPSDVSFHFLMLVADELHRRGVPALAILTPTNHVLLHEYIDTPEYVANLRTSTLMLRSRGIGVLNLDHAFPGTDFIDNDHLNAAGNLRLAKVLRAALQ